jgi:hypothetical protein
VDGRRKGRSRRRTLKAEMRRKEVKGTIMDDARNKEKRQEMKLRRKHKRSLGKNE